MRRAALILFVLLPGLATVLACGYCLLLDWTALARAFQRFERVVSAGGDLRAVTVANDLQNVYRLNCFADGIGVLGGLVLCALAVHGLCLLPAPPCRQD